MEGVYGPAKGLAGDIAGRDGSFYLRINLIDDDQAPLSIKSSLIPIVSHEPKTPLTSMGLATSFMVETTGNQGAGSCSMSRRSCDFPGRFP